MQKKVACIPIFITVSINLQLLIALIRKRHLPIVKNFDKTMRQTDVYSLFYIV